LEVGDLVQEPYDSVRIVDLVIFLVVDDLSAADAALSASKSSIDEADSLMLPQLSKASVDPVQIFLQVLD